MAFKLIGGITLLAIFLAFVNMGTPFGTVCRIASTVGVLVTYLLARKRLRSEPFAHTTIKG